MGHAQSTIRGTSLFDKLIDLVACCEPEGTILYANPALCRALGKAREQVVGVGADVLWDDPERRLSQAIARVARTGETEQLESLHGASQHWFAHSVYLADDQVWTIARDITEQKQAAQRLAASANASHLAQQAGERLAVIGNSLPVLVSLIDRERRYQFVNATYEAWFGEPPARLLGRKMDDVLGPAAYEVLEPFVDVALSGRAISFRSRLTYRSGDQRDVEITYTPYVVQERVEGFVALVSDVSEAAALAREREALLEREHEARRVAEHREERLKQLVEGSPYAVAMLDRSMRYLFASKRWITDLRIGLTVDEIRGRSHFELFPEIPAHWHDVHRRCLAGEVVRNDGEEFRRADGRSDWIRWEERPWIDDRGEIGGVLIFSEDVSAAKQHEAELKHAIAARDEFLSVASHELRTPLTALDLQLDGLQRLVERQPEYEARPTLLRKIGIALRQADRLTLLVDKLLSVSRISTEPAKLELESFDLVQLLQEVNERFEEEALRAGSRIEVATPDSALGRWDRTRLDQAITNVLSNAIKYGAGKPIDITLTSAGELVTLAVRDRGIGIPNEHLERIFGRFERAVSSHHYGGLGLGLFIAQQIVAAHGGDIRVNSRIGEGTTFSIVLPRLAKDSCVVRAVESHAQAPA